MKKARLGFLALFMVSAIGLGMVMSGCESLIGPSDTTTTVKVTTTTTAATSSTTTTATTTPTTIPVTSGEVSGTISWSWTTVATPENHWGTLLVATATVEDINKDTMVAMTIESVAINETSKGYTFTGLTNGTHYYILSFLNVATTEFGDPRTGDFIGMYPTGHMQGTHESVVCPTNEANFSLLDTAEAKKEAGNFHGVVGYNGAPLPNGIIYVRLSQDPSLNVNFMTSAPCIVSGSTTEVLYEIKDVESGDYYVWASLLVGTTETRSFLAGDKAGEYDGNFCVMPDSNMGNWLPKGGLPQLVSHGEGDDEVNITNLGSTMQ